MHNVFTKSGEQSEACIVADRDFSDFNNYDLMICYDAINMVRGILSGFLNQPRLEKDGEITPAGVFIEDLLEFLDEVETVIVVANENSSPNTIEQSEWRKWLMVKVEADLAVDFPSLAKIVSNAQNGRGSQ